MFSVESPWIENAMKLGESAKKLIGLCAKIPRFKPGVQNGQVVWKSILVAFEQLDPET